MQKLVISLLFLCASAVSFAQSLPNKIPIDPHRWYQINNCSRGLDDLFDGYLYANANTGFGKMFNNFDAYYPLLDGEQMVIDSIRFFDWQSTMSDYPVTISVITSDWKKIEIAKFTGAQYNVWVGPHNEQNLFALDSIIPNIRYIVLNAWYQYPAEMELYGSYTPPPVTPIVTKPVQLKNFFGVNAFEWDFINGVTGQLDNTKVNAMKGFAGFRHYMDWEKLESVEGKYTFNPVHSGGWNYDTIYATCKANGIEVLADLKTLPNWLLNTYPSNQRDAENVPVRYGKDFSDPNSYIEQAKVAFQYAARYGSNPNIDTALVSVDASQRWTGDPVNKKRIGLNYVKYIECDNERDKWWKGRKAYQTGREYAANLSAFYDGNKNTMGPGVGIKNADSTMQVVMCGVALATPDFLKGMVDWCKEFRGTKPDGSINFCWDVINYHFISNDTKTSQGGYPTRGVAPETGNGDSTAYSFLLAAHQFAADMPVWITETGYDDTTSPYKAIPIGTKTAALTKADWTLRTSLMYARRGIQKVFFYELTDNNPGGTGQFATCGLLHQDRSRKPAGNFIYQTLKTFGEYTYKETLKNDPIVDRYEWNGYSMYAVMIGDEVGRTGNSTINLGDAIAATIYTPTATGDMMATQTVNVVNGQLTITATETPVFVVPVSGNYVRR